MEVVLQVLPGVAPALLTELARSGTGAVLEHTDDEVRLALAGEGPDLTPLRRLRTAVAAYVVVASPARRPTGLLATEVQQEVRAAVALIRRQRPRPRFTAVRLAAAGAHTDVMRRLVGELCDVTGLPEDGDDGDLLVRVRRRGDGWELLLRTTPRPLSARDWRTERYPGALNATIAAAVVEATDPAPSDRFADLMCGSGTLVLERLARGPAERVLACDVSPDAVAVARAHQRAARLKGAVEFRVADVRDVVPDDDAGFTTIVANPPWGELVGEHATNDALYRDLLAAAGRIAAPGALLAVLTHDIRRFEGALRSQGEPAGGAWELRDTHRFFAKGHHPRLFRLRRTT